MNRLLTSLVLLGSLTAGCGSPRVRLEDHGALFNEDYIDEPPPADLIRKLKALHDQASLSTKHARRMFSPSNYAKTSQPKKSSRKHAISPEGKNPPEPIPFLSNDELDALHVFMNSEYDCNSKSVTKQVYDTFFSESSTDHEFMTRRLLATLAFNGKNDEYFADLCSTYSERCVAIEDQPMIVKETLDLIKNDWARRIDREDNSLVDFYKLLIEKDSSKLPSNLMGKVGLSSWAFKQLDPVSQQELVESYLSEDNVGSDTYSFAQSVLNIKNIVKSWHVDARNVEKLKEKAATQALAVALDPKLFITQFKKLSMFPYNLSGNLINDSPHSKEELRAVIDRYTWGERKERTSPNGKIGVYELDSSLIPLTDKIDDLCYGLAENALIKLKPQKEYARKVFDRISKHPVEDSLYYNALKLVSLLKLTEVDLDYAIEVLEQEAHADGGSKLVSWFLIPDGRCKLPATFINKLSKNEHQFYHSSIQMTAIQSCKDKTVLEGCIKSDVFEDNVKNAAKKKLGIPIIQYIPGGM